MPLPDVCGLCAARTGVVRAHDYVAKPLYETDPIYLGLPKPVDIRHPCLMSPSLSHPGFAFLEHLAVSTAAKLLHRAPAPQPVRAAPSAAMSSGHEIL